VTSTCDGSEKNRVCTKQEIVTSSSTCATSDEDCGQEEYCSAGECAAVGPCKIDADCFNPSRVYYYGIACIGVLKCSGNGQCSQTCECPHVQWLLGGSLLGQERVRSKGSLRGRLLRRMQYSYQFDAAGNQV
jgi:hypothetical protein